MMRGKGLGVFLLVMLITGAVDSIRNLPATALFGNTLIFFFIFAAVLVLFPIALVSAELSSTYTKHSGVFDWVRIAFGEKIGFLAIWLQWINTMVWYPTILAFIAATVSFLIDPALAENKVYMVSMILAVFWFLTLINLRGIQTSARFASVCAIIGLIIPIILIITLSALWVILKEPIQLHFTPATMVPHFGHSESWISLTAIITAFLGVELATVHVKQVKNPQKTFPKAMLYSVIIISLTMILGSLAIAIVIPLKQIHLVDGILQAFRIFLVAFHMGWLLDVLVVMILIGSMGAMINWIISPAKGLYRAAHYGYLPAFLAKENKHDVPANMLILQAVLVTFICLAFLLMPSVNASYWLLTDLSTEVYMLMYLLMFLAAIKLKYKVKGNPDAYRIPGGFLGMLIVCLLGLFGTAVALTVGFIPPDSFDVGLHYVQIFTLGMVGMVVPVVFFYGYKRFSYPAQ